MYIFNNRNVKKKGRAKSFYETTHDSRINGDNALALSSAQLSVRVSVRESFVMKSSVRILYGPEYTGHPYP